MRKSLWLVAAVALFLFPTVVLADSINPTTFTATVGVGGTASVNKTVTVTKGTPTSSKVDVFFLADTTGSMGGSLAAVSAGASGILTGTSLLGDVAWGVGEYKDQPSTSGDPYAYRLNQAVTTSTAAVTTGIGLWGASGGGDLPEANLYALNSVATGPTGFRPGSTRILVWFGDAVGHDPSGGVTEASATAALVAAGIKVEAIDVGIMDSSGQGTRIAAATGGTLFTGISTSTIVATILSAITTSFDTYTSVGLDLSEAGLAGVGASYGGPTTGTFDRSIDRTFGFTVAFTGLAPGSYSFDTYGTVDGGRVATESDRITVTGGKVPEPATLLLLGSGLVGLIGYRRRARMM